jgi:hypothetical protein
VQLYRVKQINRNASNHLLVSQKSFDKLSMVCMAERGNMELNEKRVAGAEEEMDAGWQYWVPVLRLNDTLYVGSWYPPPPTHTHNVAMWGALSHGDGGPAHVLLSCTLSADPKQTKH